MKKKCLFWPLMAATVMFCASCNNETIPEIEKNEGKSATVKISIESSSTRASSGTETAVGNESLITRIEAYTFNNSGVLTGYAVETVTQENPTVSSITLAAEEGPCTIVVVTNSYDQIERVTPLEELQKKLSKHVFDYQNSTSVPEKGFVMTGSANVDIVEGNNYATLPVKRTVSKFIEPTFSDSDVDFLEIPTAQIIDLFENYQGTEDLTFEFISFALANGLDKTLLFNIAYPDTEWKANRVDWGIPFPFNYLNSSFDNKNYATTEGVYSGELGTSSVYVHENFPYPDFEKNSVTGYNPKEVYCFIIEGKLLLNGGGSPDTEAIRYWRINLVKETTNPPGVNDLDMYRIYRNGLYKVNVDKIMTAGHSTPQEAEQEVDVIPVDDEAVIKITVKVEDWDLYKSHTQM